MVLIAMLCGCGGGGGGGSSPSPATVSGTASQGTALATGTTVNLKDATGKKTTGTVGANGVYSVVVDGFTAPYVLNAGGYYSFASGAGVTNINPFTHLCMQIAIGTATINDSTVLPANFPTLFITVVATLKTQTSGLYPSTVSASQMDFLNGTITIGAWVDKIFDNITIVAPDASGNFTISSGGQQILTGAKSNGTVVMTPMATAFAFVSANLFPVATTNQAFTTAMVSGKVLTFASSENTAGSLTFNTDGTFSMANLTTGVAVTGKWTINTSGQLLTIVSGGQSNFLGETDIFSLTSSTSTTFSAKDNWTVQSGVTGSLNATFTLSSLVNTIPTATNGVYNLQAGETAPTALTSSLVSGKTFNWGNVATKNYGVITFSADATGSWTGLATTKFNNTTGWTAAALFPTTMPIIVISTNPSTNAVTVDTLNIVALGSSYYVVSDLTANTNGISTYTRLYYGTNAAANAKAYSGN